MKDARTMFEELGYETLYKFETYMYYTKPLILNPEYEKDWEHLEFNLIEKTINKTYGDDNSVSDIKLDELNAINQQCKELNWID